MSAQSLRANRHIRLSMDSYFATPGQAFSPSLPLHAPASSTRCIKELSVKHCRELRYAEGGHMFAAALGIAVAVYSSVSLTCLASFTAHVGIVRCLAFSRGDRILYSAGADGNIHAWDMVRSRQYTHSDGHVQPRALLPGLRVVA